MRSRESGSYEGIKVGFSGHGHDDEGGLINMGGRVYDPVLKRFLSPDPTVPDPTHGPSWNRYAYARGNPLSFVDPTGYSDCEVGRCGVDTGEQEEDDWRGRITVGTRLIDGMVGDLSYRVVPRPLVLQLRNHPGQVGGHGDLIAQAIPRPGQRGGPLGSRRDRVNRINEHRPQRPLVTPSDVPGRTPVLGRGFRFIGVDPATRKAIVVHTDESNDAEWEFSHLEMSDEGVREVYRYTGGSKRQLPTWLGAEARAGAFEQCPDPSAVLNAQKGAKLLGPAGQISGVLRRDVVLYGGRSGLKAKSLVGPPSSVVRGGGQRAFVTNDKGQVILDITALRVKPVTPGVGAGTKRAPTAEELQLLEQVWRP